MNDLNQPGANPLVNIYNRREHDHHLANLYKEVLVLKEAVAVVRERMDKTNLEQIQVDTKQICSILESFKIMLTIAKWCAGISAAVAAVFTAIAAIKLGVQAFFVK